MDHESQLIYQANFLKSIRERAYRELASAAFDETKLAEVMPLYETEQKRLNVLLEDENKLEEKSNRTKEDRQALKTIKGEIASAAAAVKRYEQTLNTIRMTVANERQSGMQYLDRAKFVETYFYEPAAEEAKDASEAAAA